MTGGGGATISTGGPSLTSTGGGGVLIARNGAGRIGESKTISGGSSGLTMAIGASEMRLPQRVRSVLTPSVITFSPLASLSLFFVQ